MKTTKTNLTNLTTGSKNKSGNKSMSAIHVLARKIIKDIIEHSIKIAILHTNHKKYQKIYENRNIKKEENIITKDSQFSGKIYSSKNSNQRWKFISKSLGRIITIDNKGEIKLYSFNNQKSKIYIIPNKDNNLIISSELYEHEQTADCRLLILYKNLIFITIDLIKLNNEKKDELSESIELSFTQPFNFKPYLNIPDIVEYIPE